MIILVAKLPPHFHEFWNFNAAVSAVHIAHEKQSRDYLILKLYAKDFQNSIIHLKIVNIPFILSIFGYIWPAPISAPVSGQQNPESDNLTQSGQKLEQWNDLY